MAGINKVILVGNLGAKPEIKYASNGNAISNLSIATSESWTDKSTGQKQERTEWHRVSLFGKVAEIAGQYLDKGSKVYVEGKLQTRKWQDQNGIDKYTTEIVLGKFRGELTMIGSRNDSASITATQDNISAKNDSNEITQKDTNPPMGGAGDLDDEIPF